MEQLINWYFIIIFFAAILGIVVASILYFINKTDTFSSKLLSGYLVCISILALNYALMTTRFFVSFPHLWRTLAWASFSFAPFAYLYTRSVLEQSYKFRKWDFILFLPAVLHALNLLPFFVLSAPEKLEIIQNALRDKKRIAYEPEGLLPEDWAIWLRITVGFIATSGGLLLLKNWRPKILRDAKNNKQNLRTFQWVLLFNLLQAFFWLLIFTEFFLHFTKKPDLNFTIIFTITGSILFVCLYLLVQPSILYGLKGWLQEPIILVSIPEKKSDLNDEHISLNRNSLSIQQGIVIKNALESHFNENFPFRKNSYTIGDLSRELNFPTHQLSAFINQEYGKNFNELINEYRVDYLTNNIKNNTSHVQYTLEAIGKEAGFNSRAAFISAVKKKTGKTPSELFGRR